MEQTGKALESAHSATEAGGYQPPGIQRLGTLAELTLSGPVGPDDGLGGAGFS